MPYLQDIAEIWAEFKDRKDNSFLARELLGRLWSNRFYERPTVDQAAVKDLVCMKILFDYQHALLRYHPPGEDALSAGDFLDCLDYISKSALQLSVRQGVDETVRKAFSQILRPLFVSGFRVTLLAIKQLSHDDSGQRFIYASLLKSILQRWPQTDAIDKEWIVPTFLAIAEDLSKDRVEGLLCSHHIPLDIPDREMFVLVYDGLTRCVMAAVECIAQNCPHSHQSILRILDARSMILAAFSSHFVERLPKFCPSDVDRTASGSTDSMSLRDEKVLCEKWIDAENALNLALNSSFGRSRRKEFLDFFREVDPGPLWQNSMPLGHEEIMAWLGPDLAAFPPQIGFNAMNVTHSRISESLRIRKSAMFDTDGFLRYTLRCADEFAKAWIPSYNQKHIDPPPMLTTPQNLIYMLACPDLHPISYKDLRDRLDEEGRQFLDKYPDVIGIHIDCPFHPESPPKVFKAKRVTPLSQVSAKLSQAIEHLSNPHIDNAERQSDVPAQVSGEDYDSISDKSFSQHGSSTTPSTSISKTLRVFTSPRSVSNLNPFFNASPGLSSSAASSSAPSTTSKMPGVKDVGKTTVSHRNGPLTDLIAQQSISRQSPRTILSYSFFTNRQTVLLWFSNTNFVTIHDFFINQSRDLQTLQPVFDVATGLTLYATLSTHGTTHNLHIHQSDNGRLVNTIKSIDTPVFCISFSIDDRFVAIGSGKTIRIYDIESNQLHKHQLPQLLPPVLLQARTGTKPAAVRKDSKTTLVVESQKISFTTAGDRFVVVTRYSNGEVHSYIFHPMTNIPEPRRLSDTKIRGGYNPDLGLTSVHLDDESNLTCITTFTSNGPVTMITDSHDAPKESINRAGLGTQIQCSFRAPFCDYFRIILVNHKNEVFLIQRHASGTGWHVKKIASPWPKKYIAQANTHLAMTMPDDETVYLFWVDMDSRGKPWTFTTVNIGN